MERRVQAGGFVAEGAPAREFGYARDTTLYHPSVSSGVTTAEPGGNDCPLGLHFSIVEKQPYFM